MEKLEKDEWVKLPRQPKGNLSTGINLEVNNLVAIYIENDESFLVNEKPLKSIAFYWQNNFASSLELL